MASRINLHQCSHEWLDDKGNRAHSFPVNKNMEKPELPDIDISEWPVEVRQAYDEYLLHWEVCDCGNTDVELIQLDGNEYRCFNCGEATCDLETLNRIKMEMTHPAI